MSPASPPKEGEAVTLAGEQKRFVVAWWKVVGLLCVLPTVAVISVGVGTVPKLPACIGSERRFMEGIAECQNEVDRRRADQRASMLTGRVLLRSFVICANLERLRRDAEENCYWLLGREK